jgi:endo-1,4-beta-xylanase
LYLNDYNFEAISNKTNAAYNYVKSLKKKGIPIHGIGAQSHLVVGTLDPTYKANLQRFSALGLDVALTELDVSLLILRRRVPSYKLPRSRSA